MKRLRDILTLEDLLWAGWLAVLRPAEGGLFLEGGSASAFLALAAACFWVAALLGARGTRRSGGMLAMSLGVCAIMIDVGLKQVGAPIELRQGHTLAVVVLGALAAWQHRSTRGGAWLAAPAWLRRGLSWPFLMLLSEFFSGLLDGLAAPRGWSERPLGETLFSAGLAFAVLMPVIYIFFVIAPRQTVRPEQPATHGTWALRYLWALAMALLGALVVAPLLGG